MRNEGTTEVTTKGTKDTEKRWGVLRFWRKQGTISKFPVFGFFNVRRVHFWDIVFIFAPAIFSSAFILTGEVGEWLKPTVC